MTRAKDISKIITDADFSGTLDVTGDLTVDTNTLYVDSTNNNVGIGTSSPIRQLSLQNSSNAEISIVSGTSSNCSLLMGDGTSGTDFYRGYIQYQNSNDAMLFATSTGERMRIDASGNVGIGTSSPSTKLEVSGASNSTATFIKPQGALPDNNDNAGLYVLHQGTAGTGLRVRTDNALTGSNFAHILVNNASASINAFQVSQYGSGYIADFNKSGTTCMRIDSSGNLLVGKTSSSLATNGSELLSNGTSFFTRSLPSGDGAGVAYFQRNTSDGNILMLYNSSASNVGSIGTTNGDLTIGTGDTGLRFHDGDNRIYTVHSTTGAKLDGAIDLGEPAGRWEDIYATNGTIQTSDRNEKQDIEELSEAEQRVATACKGLLRKWKWKSAVAEKGDNARTHFGIIAQDLQDAFTAEGLDAGDYAMFISDTWWEKEISVDAVEADEENGIKAQDAYINIFHVKHNIRVVI